MAKSTVPYLILAVVTFLAAALTACQASQRADQAAAGSGSYRNVEPAELKAMLEDKRFFLVDVHVPNEGHLSRTDARIPFDKIEQHLAELPADKSARIVLYCRSGRMSQIASEKLVQLGYTDVWNLTGGFVAWEDAGFPLEPN